MSEETERILKMSKARIDEYFRTHSAERKESEAILDEALELLKYDRKLAIVLLCRFINDKIDEGMEMATDSKGDMHMMKGECFE